MLLVIEPQSLNRSAADGGESQDSRAFSVPPEMIRPALSARVVQWLSCLSYRVNRLDLSAFEAVAASASQPKVTLVVCSATSQRDKLYFERSDQIALMAAAVATPIAGSGAHSLA